jgi:hypothetical protein
MKKIKNYFYFHKKVREALGDDLVYSLALDGDMHVLAVSVHKSKTLCFKHGRKIQTCIIDNKDLNRNMEDLIADVIRLYKEVLVPRDNPVDDNQEKEFNETAGLIRV